ncbi:MAG: CheR family methyltransferase, partial [Gemmatimonadota bacterium]
MRRDEREGVARRASAVARAAADTATSATAGRGSADEVASPEDFLVRGELTARDARELERLKRQIRRATGRLCHCYKERGLRRRLAVRMRARGVHRYGEYARILRREPEEYEELVRQLTIHVSRFFRNPEVWDAVAERVLPELFAVDSPTVPIWSVGAAGGEEPYTLAILLASYAETHGLEPRLDRFRILATDVDAEVIEAARRAEYDAAALQEVPAEVRERWFEGGPPWRPIRAVRELVEFRRADVLSMAFPSAVRLIVCRNLTIYLDREVQPVLYDRFHEALAPRGFLVLGKVETILG